ncbi:MAG: cytochrome bd-I oxidase subunit CydH [Vibrio sp.]
MNFNLKMSLVITVISFIVFIGAGLIAIM